MVFLSPIYSLDNPVASTTLNKTLQREALQHRLAAPSSWVDLIDLALDGFSSVGTALARRWSTGRAPSRS